MPPWLCAYCQTATQPPSIALNQLPIAMSPTVQALTAQRDALLEAEQRYQLDLHTVKAERDELLAALRKAEKLLPFLIRNNNPPTVYHEALDAARLAIAKAEGKT